MGMAVESGKNDVVKCATEEILTTKVHGIPNSTPDLLRAPMSSAHYWMIIFSHDFSIVGSASNRLLLLCISTVR